MPMPLPRTLRPLLLLLMFWTLPPGATTPATAHPLFWDWPYQQSFIDLQWQGAGLDADGHLVAGPQGQDLPLEGAEVCWTVAADGSGGFFAGTGHGGRIFHVDSRGRLRLHTTVGASQVFSLLPLDGGGLLAGCGPDGQLYRVDEDGQASLLGAVPGGYVWDLVQADERIYLVSGSPAALYRLDAGDGLTLVREFPARNALDVALDAEGRLLVGTQGPGLVYRIDPARKDAAELLCEVPQDEVRHFVSGPTGEMHLLALPGDENDGGGESDPRRQSPVPPEVLRQNGNGAGSTGTGAALYRLDETGGLHRVWSGDLDLMMVTHSPRWGWLGGGAVADQVGRSQLFGLQEQGGHHVVSRWPGGDILAIEALPSGDLVVAQAHPGGVRMLLSGGKERALALSPPLDGGRPVQWGRLSHRSEGSAQLRWNVRGGNRAQPDESWTDWSKTFSSTDQALDLPRTRFLQWRVELPQGERDGIPVARLAEVSVSALAGNTAPSIVRFDLENLSEASEGGLHKGSENVTQTFASGLRVEFSRKSEVGHRAGLARSAFTRPVRVMTWKGEDPDRDRLVYTLEYRREGDDLWRTILTETPESLGSWDTAGLPDGRYRLRLTASDHRDNPAGQGLQAVREIGPVTLDNSPPELDSWRCEESEAGARIRFSARDEASALAEAWVVLPYGSRRPLPPRDGICDSREEVFDSLVPWQEGPRPWVFRVEVWDLNGNVVEAEGVLP